MAAAKRDDVRTAYLEGGSIAALARDHGISRGAIRTAVADLMPNQPLPAPTRPARQWNCRSPSTCPARSPLPVPLAGQFVTLRLHPRADGAPLIRSYSVSGPPEGSSYRITVKHEPHGRVSGYLGEHVREGDLLDVAASRGTFTDPR